MTTFDFTPYAVGGAQRPDSFSGMSPDFATALGQLLTAAPKGYVQVSSGYRSPDRQAQLWADAIKKYGNADAARKWVAPPGRSKHNHGQAADLKFMNDEARKWVHANAQRFGLSFPLSNENWHVEPIGARGGHQHAPASTSTLTGSAPASTHGFTDGPASPPTLSDIAIPQTPAAPDLGNVVAGFMQGRERRAEQEAAERVRRAALFGDGGLADLYA